MKLTYKILIFLACWLTVGFTYAQELTVLPYKVIANKMIVEVRLNGKQVSMIFDTGGKNAITTELSKTLGTSVINTREIVDANMTKKRIDIVKLDQVETPDAKTVFKDIPFIVVDNELFTCLQVGGLIGSDLWQHNTVEIDDQAKEIRIRAGGMDALKDNKQSIPFAADAGGDPVFSLKVGKFDEARVLFDSGADGFLSIRSKDYLRLEQQGALYMIRQGKGKGGIGVIGKSEVTANRILLEVRELNIGNASFTKFRAGVGSASESLLGYRALHYGKITIDYVNKLFCFEPFKPGKIEVEPDLKKTWDLEVSEENNQLIVGSVWQQMEGEVEVGDVITKVDGKEVEPTSFCKNLITGIPVLKEKDQAVLTIKTKQGIKNITINRN